MSKGYLWFAQNNDKTDYVKLSISLAERDGRDVRGGRDAPLIAKATSCLSIGLAQFEVEQQVWARQALVWLFAPIEIEAVFC